MLFIMKFKKKKRKGKAVPVIGHGGLRDCEMSRIPYFVDTQSTYNG
jgi:hypothetical protein